MNLLLFEWLMGGGLLCEPAVPDAKSTMFRQGREMFLAVAEDLARVGFSIVSPIDERVQTTHSSLAAAQMVTNADQLRPTLEQMADQADQILFVAPETNGCLLKVCEWLSPWAYKWICPDQEFVRLASDKSKTIERLIENSVPVCPGHLLRDHQSIPFPTPAVLKPNSGAGSEHIQMISKRSELPVGDQHSGQWRVEEYVPGLPVSVSIFATESKQTVLTPMQQVFDSEPIGHFVEARPLNDVGLEQRAVELAYKVVNALPATRGYFGIDMVLGDKSTGDVVIEVNPRLTMSYCQLRTLHPDLYSSFLQNFPSA